MSTIEILKAGEDRTEATDDVRQLTIEGLLAECTYPGIIEVMHRVSALDVGTVNRIPYAVFWHRYTASQTANVLMGILLYENLVERLQALEEPVTRIICDKPVSPLYCRVIEDVGRELSLPVERRGSSNVRQMARRVSEVILLGFKLVAMFVDELLGVVLGLTGDESEETLFVPAINRPRSTDSVLREFDRRPLVLTPEPIIWRLASSNEYLPPAFDAFSIHRFVTLRCLIPQIRDLVGFLQEAIRTGAFSDAVGRAITSEFGISMDATVSHWVRNTMVDFRLLRGLLIRHIVADIGTRYDFDRVVVGSLDPIGRSVVHECLRHDLRAFHIPHSIATSFPPNPPRDTVQFVAGAFDLDFYEEMVPEELAWEWIPLGRPYLADLASQREGSQGQSRIVNRELNVVVATQPGAEENRRALVQAVVAGLEARENEFALTIKTHPDERIELYDEFTSGRDRITLETDDLLGHLRRADLVVTINSNVGLEAMVLGTPCVCFNPWRPFVFEQTYALTGEVPVLRSEEDLTAYLRDLREQQLVGLRSEQELFVAENYRLTPSVSADIAAYIESH
jgi:hypothetical protein